MVLPDHAQSHPPQDSAPNPVVGACITKEPGPGKSYETQKQSNPQAPTRIVYPTWIQKGLWHSRRQNPFLDLWGKGRERKPPWERKGQASQHSPWAHFLFPRSQWEA